MRNWKVIVAILVGVALSGTLSGTLSGALYAQQKGGKKLTAEDYVEIYRLYYRYNWAADARDGKTWSNLFTPDGVFEVVSSGKKDEGREALMQAPQKGLGTATATTALHFVTNVWVEPSPGGARGGAYLLNVAPGEPGKPSTITSVAFYEDTLVKTPDGWRLKLRRAHSEGGLAPSIIAPPSN